jgi:Spy/CpxP family protein refolding chaperone
MKSRLALVAMLVVAAAPLAAQGGGGAPGGGRGMGGRGMNIEAMTALYTLTPEQVTKADALLKKYQESTMPLQQYMMAQRQGGGEVNPDSMKKSTELRTKFNADFKALLTGDQVKKFDSVQAAQAARMGGRGPGGL